MSTKLHLLIALAAGLVLSACTGGSVDVPKTIETPTLTNSSQIDLPLSAYLPSDDENRLVDKAVVRYQVQCAQRFGVTLQAEDSYIEPAIPQRRYGLINRDEVEVYGYGMPPAPGQEEDDDEKKEEVASPKQALEDEVMTGNSPDGSRSTLKDTDGKPLPEGGCGQEGWDRVRGDIPFDYDDLPENLMSQAIDLTFSDPRYLEAEKDWAACMRKAGYEFEHLHEAGNSVQDKDIKTQKAMALLEVDCSLEVNLPGRAMAIDVEHQYKLIKENEAQLRDVLDKKNKLVNNAKEAFK